MRTGVYTILLTLPMATSAFEIKLTHYQIRR